MTPLEIEILMHYFCRGVDHKDALNQPQAQKEAFKRFVDEGYLDKSCRDKSILATSNMHYTPTAKLNAYCVALCNMPEPHQEWIVSY